MGPVQISGLEPDAIIMQSMFWDLLQVSVQGLIVWFCYHNLPVATCCTVICVDLFGRSPVAVPSCCPGSLTSVPFPSPTSPHHTASTPAYSKRYMTYANQYVDGELQPGAAAAGVVPPFDVEWVLNSWVPGAQSGLVQVRPK